MFLHIANAFGDHVNQNVEFGGSGLKHLSLNARRTIATMGAEISAEFAIFEADDLILDYVRERNKAPFEAQYPDAGRASIANAARSRSATWSRWSRFPIRW